LPPGAVQSPQLLQVSGIGDAAHLARIGVPLLLHRPEVGRNLQDHLQIRLMYKVSKPITTNDDLAQFVGQGQNRPAMVAVATRTAGHRY
jgi:choline dehydrogenase